MQQKNRYIDVLNDETTNEAVNKPSIVEKIKSAVEKVTGKSKVPTYTPPVENTTPFIQSTSSSIALGLAVAGITKVYLKQNWVTSSALGVAVTTSKMVLIDKKDTSLPNEQTKF